MKKLYSAAFVGLLSFALASNASSNWDFFSLFNDDEPKSKCSDKINIVGVLDFTPEVGIANTEGVASATKILSQMLGKKNSDKSDKKSSITSDISKSIQDSIDKIHQDIEDSRNRIHQDIEDSRNRIHQEIEDSRNRIHQEIEDSRNRIHDEINSSFSFEKKKPVVCKTKVIAVITTIEVPVEDGSA